MTSYRAEEIKQRLLEFCTLFSFSYDGQDFGIDPFNPRLFRVYSGDDEMVVNSIDDLMTMPLFAGKSLTEIAGDVEILDW